MLELPEVEVLRKDIEREIVGRRVKTVEVTTPSVVRPFHRTRPQFVEALTGRKITGVSRRGTVLLLALDEGLTWIIDPGEHGTLHRETSTAPPGPHTLLVATFTIGSALHLTDTADEPASRTGVVPTEEALAAAGIDPGAIDPLEDNPTWPQFAEILRRRAAPLKQVLTDPSVLLGIGPVYSDEILWEAGLRWDRPSDSLTTQEVRRLYRAIHEVLMLAIKARGTSLADAEPEDVLDEEGEPLEHIRVYGREHQPCFRCRQLIVKQRIRRDQATYLCPQCQI